MTQQRHGTLSGTLARTALASAAWRKSTYSDNAGNCVEAAPLGSARWHKSSYSGNEGNCVQIAADVPSAVAVRDSKNPGGPPLVFTQDAWTAFIARVRRGESGRT